MDDMEQDPDRINDADRQIEATIFKQGQDYADRNKRSKAENKGRAESRAKIKEIGMDPNAYATAVRLIKDKTPAELVAWRRDFDLTLKVMGSKQKELFPEEQLRAEARAQRQAEKAAGKPRDKAELDAKTDTDPKSDPKAGGAQIDLEEAIAAQAREQAEGDAILAGKPEAWRQGYNAHGAKVERKDNPFIEGSADAREWLLGYAASSEREFAAAAPDAEPPAPPAEEPKAKSKKPSQSAKAKAIKDAAGL